MKRREFLKKLGIGTITIALAPCVVKKKPVEVNVGRLGAIVDNLGMEVMLPRRQVFELSVTGQDDWGDRRIIVGDPLYFHWDTGVINAAPENPIMVGYANGVVDPGETKSIPVLIDESPSMIRYEGPIIMWVGDECLGEIPWMEYVPGDWRDIKEVRIDDEVEFWSFSL